MSGFGRSYAPATSGGSREPRCGTREYGDSPLDQLAEQFMEQMSQEPAYTTVEDTLLNPNAPEHVAAIIESKDGGLRLGRLSVSEPVRPDFVGFEPPTIGNGGLRQGKRFVLGFGQPAVPERGLIQGSGCGVAGVGHESEEVEGALRPGHIRVPARTSPSHGRRLAPV